MGFRVEFPVWVVSDIDLAVREARECVQLRSITLDSEPSPLSNLLFFFLEEILRLVTIS